MAAKRHPTSLTAVPTNLAIEITDHLTVTSKWPMDDLHSLWATCSSMLGIYSDPTIGRRVAVDRCRCGARSLNDLVNYFTLLARLTQVENPEACMRIRIQTVFTKNHSPRPCLDYLTRTANGGHNVSAYLVVIFFYRHNGSVGDDNTTRRYIRRVEGKEESLAAAMPRGSHERDPRNDVVAQQVVAAAGIGARRSSMRRRRLRRSKRMGTKDSVLQRGL